MLWVLERNKKLDYNAINQLGKQVGFSKITCVDPAKIELKEEVRRMCEINSCGMYEKRWSCPPGCGALPECRDRIKKYREGILVQTIGCLDGVFDIEGMQKAEERHKKYFEEMHERLREMFSDVLALGSGCCRRCQSCTYPTAPCRYPEKMTASMEAYGILVLQVCKDHQMQYYYGRDKIAYVGCFLF